MKRTLVVEDGFGGYLNAHIPEAAIPCTLLARATDYPKGYAAAERTLDRNGWIYQISEDTWFSPATLEFFRGRRA